MARIPYLTPDDITDTNREVLKRDVNLYWAAGHAPGAAAAYSQMGLWFRFDSKFDKRLRELAILTVGYVNRSVYEWAHHIRIGYDFGVTDHDIERLMQELEGQKTDLPDLDRHVILGAAEIARDAEMSDLHWTALSAAFDTELMTELVLGVSFYCAIVRVLKTLQVDLEPDAVPYAERHPLPA